MRKENLISVFTLLGAFCLGGCTDSELLNDASGQVDLSEAKSEIPDFSTSSYVKVSFDYAMPGMTALLNFYDENDINSDNSVKEGATPFFAVFTDENGKFVGNVDIPKYLKKIYVVCNNTGFPKLTTVDVVNNSINYTRKIDSRAVRIDKKVDVSTRIDLNTNATLIDESKNLFKLYSSINEQWEPINNTNDNIYLYSRGETSLGIALNFLKSYFENPSGSTIKNLFLRNQIINRNLVLDVPQNNTGHFDAVLLFANTCNNNAIGYYYYKSDDFDNASDKKDFIEKLPKFIITPLVNIFNPDRPLHIRLQYFGDNGKEAGLDNFPAGYKVGFMMIPNIECNNNADVDGCLVKQISNNVIYSNLCANKESYKANVLMVTDSHNSKMFGFSSNNNCNIFKYDDAIIYVNSNIKYDDEDNPVMPDCDDCEVTCTNNSVLLFEDQWPDGNDYDMNDVMLSHSRSVTFDKDNIISKISDSFTLIKDTLTDFHSAFGFQILEGSDNPNYEGQYTVIPTEKTLEIKEGGSSKIEPIEFESGINHQYIIFTDHKQSYGKTFILTRTYDKSAKFLQRNYNPIFNYFICPRAKGDFIEGSKRKEVHMYGRGLSTLGDADYAAFTDKNMFNFALAGAEQIEDHWYPYALELAHIKTFDPVRPGCTIGMIGYRTPEGVTPKRIFAPSKQYPSFNDWADSKGTKYQAWYLYKNKKCDADEIVPFGQDGQNN